MMECNKEEAIRAKDIAAKKMQDKDYSGARRVALKAQQLYPDLENISHLILVCDVHLSADSKAYGNEKDWYGILKIEPTADEASIKKQYRKFALLLHPDKNRFAGAADAFKLIGEAHRVLLDPVKRSFHDAKIKGWKQNSAPPKQANKNPNTGPPQPWTKSHFMGKNNTSYPGFTTQQQQSVKPTQATFWTMCPYCTVKYEYFRDVVNKNFMCQCCKKSFTGYEIKDKATGKYPQWTQPNHGAFKPNEGSKVGSQKNASFEPQKRESVGKTRTSEVGGDSRADPKFTNKVNGKRKKQTNRSSVRFDSNSRSKSKKEDTVEENGDVQGKQKFGSSGENKRKSNRSKLNISFEENDLGSPSKKRKPNRSFNVNGDPGSEKEASSIPMEEDDLNKMKPEETAKGNTGSTAMENGEKTSDGAKGGGFPDWSSNEPTVPEFYDNPDPDFNDFDKDRKDDCFAVGQVWALYDPLDAMPRFYARIKKVISLPEFKLRVTWLEADPDDEDESKWVDAELPVSCGKLRTGSTEIINGCLVFSHRADWEKGSKRDTYKIYPRKEDTWALFKDWDMNWHSDIGTKRKYEFEFVEILSDYCEEDGVYVAYLGKVKGFSCLFCGTARGADSFNIPRNQLFRFSHRVPSFGLSGEEREDIPKSSFELDPVSFSANLVEIDIPKDSKVEVETVEISEENPPLFKEEKKPESDSEGISNSSELKPEAYEIPKQEFFNFDGEKSPDKFQPGQYWALYSDKDSLPKYYGFINKMFHRPKFKIQVTWLDACPSKNIVNYADKRLPIGCGIFKPLKGSSSSYTDTNTFSHILKVETTDKKDVYAIYPRKAEVWAVYKNWNSRMTLTDLENCEYDTVEVLEENDFAFKTVMLEVVSGHKSVFKPQIKNGSPVSIEILRTGLLRFSHQIPAFRLTDEKGGSLRGYWELDLAAFPIRKFHSS